MKWVKKGLEKTESCLVAGAGFSSEGRAKMRVGVLNVPWSKNSKPLEVQCGPLVRSAVLSIEN